MELFFEQDVRLEAVRQAAARIMTAARTAPKGKGVDNTVVALVDKAGIREISDRMKEMARRDGLPDLFLRDAVNILSADAMVIFGSRIASMNLPRCGMCGFRNCAEREAHPQHPCVFNAGDLGIAMGSAAAAAMDARVDSRIMYTVGLVLLEMGVLGEDVGIAYGMPLSIGPKNPFFDRDWEKLVSQA